MAGGSRCLWPAIAELLVAAIWLSADVCAAGDARALQGLPLRDDLLPQPQAPVTTPALPPPAQTTAPPPASTPAQTPAASPALPPPTTQEPVTTAAPEVSFVPAAPALTAAPTPAPTPAPLPVPLPAPLPAEESATAVAAAGAPANAGAHEGSAEQVVVLPSGTKEIVDTPAAGEGEHGAHHGGHHEGHHAAAGNNEAVTATAAASLLGMTAGTQVLFYLVNCRLVLVRRMTWRMVSAAVSIFAAILAFGTVNELLRLVGVKHMIPFLRTVLAWICSQMMMYRNKEHLLKATATATIWGHTTGFFAIADFGHIQDVYLSKSVFSSLLAVLFAAAVLLSMAAVTRYLRRAAALVDDGHMDKLEETWDHHCAEYEDDVATMSLGNLIAQVARFVAAGRFIRDSHDPLGVDERGIFELNMWAALFVFLLVLATAIRHRMDLPRGETITRVFSVGQHLFSMAAAWTLLFALRWQYVGPWTQKFESAVPAMLLLALCVSLAGIGALMLLNIVSHECDVHVHTLKAMNAAMGLLVGLCWEVTFHHSIEELAESDAVYDPSIIKVGLSVLLFIVVYPSWSWYILPKSDKKLKHFEKKVMKDSEDLELEKAMQESESHGGSGVGSGSGTSDEESRGDVAGHYALVPS